MRIFISGPSGVGKSTIIRAFLARNPATVLSISYTTRAPRPGEEHGREYFFVAPDHFKSMIAANEFLEWAEVHGNYYGTGLEWVTAKESQGHAVLFDIDVQGVFQAQELGSSGLYIMIVPPDMDSLRQRLAGRGTEDDASLNIRLANARKELARWEMYDYLVVNDRIETAVDRLQAIVDAHKATTIEMIGELAWLREIK